MKRTYPDKPEIQIGDILLYRLRHGQIATDPRELWRGRVEMRLVNVDDRSQRHYYLISSLEEDYEGLQDLVYPGQVVEVVSRTPL